MVNYLPIVEGDTGEVAAEKILNSVNLKADSDDVYTKQEVYNKEEVYAKDEVYNKEEVYDKDNVYNKQETYTKLEVETLIPDTSEFITKTVDDLTNYYTKTNTYTKSEVNSLVQNVAGFKVVSDLPTQDIKKNIIYMKGPIGSGNDKYEERIYDENNTRIKIGETSIDLSPYFNMNNNDSDDITQGETNLFLTSAERTKLGNTSGTNSGDETSTSIKNKLGITTLSGSNTGDETQSSIKDKLKSATNARDGYLTKEDWATFNGKQNTLPTQTAYSSKGTAKKVATITTNTNGQVTDITETDISFPAETVVSGDSGTTYTLKTSSTVPTVDDRTILTAVF